MNRLAVFLAAAAIPAASDPSNVSDDQWTQLYVAEAKEAEI